MTVRIVSKEETAAVQKYNADIFCEMFRRYTGYELPADFRKRWWPDAE